ncbi:MAG: hypothetical protein GY828_00195 [Candidatus Gracilibacteria bacterium]|nr:hypothetical protein [Candidatus Gracilibacteria bacterium]
MRTGIKKIYFATGNKQKIERMQSLCHLIADDFHVEPMPDLIPVEENGETPIDNAILKVSPYRDLDAPIIAGDTGLYFDDMVCYPTHVKRTAIEDKGKKVEDCSQDEIYSIMLEYYKNLAVKHGGEFPFYFLDGWAFKSVHGNLKTFLNKRENILTSLPQGEKQLYFPMCNLYKSRITGKYYTQWTEEDMLNELVGQKEMLEEIYEML